MGERRAIAAIAVAAFAIAAAATGVATPACATHRCDPGDILQSGDATNGSGVLIGNTWQSSEIDGAWLQFAPEHIVRLWLPPALKGRRAIQIVAFLSVDPYPVSTTNGPNANMVLAAGNSAEIQFNEPGPNIDVINGTCETYYLRVVATFEPAADASTDAGTE